MDLQSSLTSVFLTRSVVVLMLWFTKMFLRLSEKLCSLSSSAFPAIDFPQHEALFYSVGSHYVFKEFKLSLMNSVE